jgi:GT2 family glycosyltransferase
MSRVSIIVPAFNYGRFLAEALDSVAAQTFTDWECIVVDDGSTDDTEAVVSHYTKRDARFRYVKQPNGGVSSARNRGLRETSAPLVQFLDADDRLSPLKIERHVAWLDAHPRTDIVYGRVTFFRTEEPQRVLHSLGGHLSKPLMAEVHCGAEALTKLQHYNIFTLLSALVRRTVFDRAGFFDETARACEDWAFWIRCAAAGCEIELDDAAEPVAMVRTHAASLSRDPRGMLQGLMKSAHSFETNPLMAGKTMPLIFDVALGIEAAGNGARNAGFRRIWNAAARATEPLSALRWRVYALCALLLPRSLFLWIAAAPMPELAFEWYRRTRKVFSE